jgi:hypothetical protein
MNIYSTAVLLTVLNIYSTAVLLTVLNIYSTAVLLPVLNIYSTGVLLTVLCTSSDFELAIEILKNHKLPVIDKISALVIKAGSRTILSEIH